MKGNAKHITLNEPGGNSTHCDLADIRFIKVSDDLKGDDRIAEYIKQIKNPNLYKCGRFTIRSNYVKNGLSLEDNLRKMMM